MSKFLLSTVLLFILMAACAPSSHKTVSKPTDPSHPLQDVSQTNAIATGESLSIDTSIYKTPSSLMDLPVS